MEPAPDQVSGSRYRRRALPYVVVAGLILALASTYAGLSVDKAFSYTTTPQRDLGPATPADYGLDYQPVSFASAAGDGVQLSGWWIAKPGSTRAVILVHGRYANRTAYLALARPLWDAGYNVLLFDLRGHGRSTPSPCTYGIKESWDVVAAAEYARGQGVPSAGIGVIGWSLGGASALMAAGQTADIAAVVTDSAYANADPLLARNPLQPGLRLALRIFRHVDMGAVRPADAAAQLRGRPLFIIQGERDVEVPPSQAALIQRAAGDSVRETWIVPDAGHTQAYSLHPEEYRARVIAFFNAALS